MLACSMFSRELRYPICSEIGASRTGQETLTMNKCEQLRVENVTRWIPFPLKSNFRILGERIMTIEFIIWITA